MALLAAALVVGGNLLAGKIQSNRQNDPKAAIGSGTAPSLQPGADIQVAPVEGSEVQDFGDFGVENMTEPENMTDQERLMAMLQEAGVSTEGLTGLAYAAAGGPLYRANGFGITNLLDSDGLKQFEELQAMIEKMSGRPPKPETRPDSGVDFTEIEPKDPSSPDALEISMDQNQLKPSIDDLEISPEIKQEQNNMQLLANYADANPELFTAGIGALGKVLNAAFIDPPERKGSIVSTQTLPGNSNRRRNNLSNITPIGGSKVTFANQGKALQRPMFMPHGGQMRGPGGPKDDLIPVMASNGEYMLSKAAVDAAGGGSHAKGLARLDAFNKMGNKRYG
jgi:hypothetical protein